MNIYLIMCWRLWIISRTIWTIKFIWPTQFFDAVISSLEAGEIRNYARLCIM